MSSLDSLKINQVNNKIDALQHRKETDKAGKDFSRLRQATFGVQPLSKEQMDKKIDKTAKEYESVFLSQMLQHMFAGVETNEAFGGGESEKIYKSMMIDEYAKTMTNAGGIGIADHVRQEMIRLQEVGSK